MLSVITRIIVFLIISIFMLSGCSSFQNNDNIETHETENPNAEAVLQLDSEADIFQLDGVIYQTNIDWIDELTLTPGDEISVIKSQEQDATAFENNTANNLPVGTKIYEPKENIDENVLLVELDGEIVNYYAIVEG